MQSMPNDKAWPSPSLPVVDPRILRGSSPLDVAPSPDPSITTLPELFRYQAISHPNSTAFSCRKDEENDALETISYAEANATATFLARGILRLSAVQRTDELKAPVVAIWLEKGLDLLFSILATTYSGATWLPFDPDVPVERAAACILDSSATILICDGKHVDRSRAVRNQTARAFAAAGRASLEVYTFDDLSTISAESTKIESWKPTGPTPQDAAYLIYTSGTTGTPKGIAIPHSAALTFSLSEREVLETTSKDVVWNGFSPAFDMFVEEMWVTVAGAGHLAIGTRDECRDASRLPVIWADRGVTLVNAVPTLIGIMGIAQTDSQSPLIPQSVRLINLGGEACPPALVRRLARPGLRIINTYGPTETTVTATWDELQPDVPVTIGRPLPSYHACVLPILEDGQPNIAEPLVLAEGIEGELAIGGPCVGLGYVGRLELTQQKFIPHPLAPNSGERLYRTGDRVRLLKDFKISFLGRIDTQIKHRGFRIELGEMEAVLTEAPNVQTAAVILANPGTDTARLEAFVVNQPDTARDAYLINMFVAQRLPNYMRPEEIYFLEANDMPRLPSGKINTKALHELSVRKAIELASSELSECDDPGSSTTIGGETPLSILLAVLASIFPLAGRIKPEADFFNDLGGHSLLAAIFVSRLRQTHSETGVDQFPFASIGLPDIYEGRTPINIAARLSPAAHSDDGGSKLADEGSDNNDEECTGPRTGDHLPVSQRKFVLCGLAQILPLIFIFFLQSLEYLVPYLLFDFLYVHTTIWTAILATYGLFIFMPLALTTLAISGKWIVLGKARQGEYPLYGLYYFRWWFAERLASFANTRAIGDSLLYPLFLRAMGARVGRYCHLGSMTIGVAYDLVDIGNDVIIGADAVLAVSLIERGRLVLKRIVIHDNAIIGSQTLIEGGAIVGEAAELGPLSMLPDGMAVPPFQRFHGSPARFDRPVHDSQAALGPRTRPSTLRASAILFGQLVLTSLVLPLFYFVPQLPGLVLFDYLRLRSISSWAQVAILSVPITFSYQLLVFMQLIVFRHLILGRLREGVYKIYSLWHVRKWFLDRLMDLALATLHPVFASLYIIPFLRSLGVKIGKGAEVSTARGIGFELLEIGEESFVADGVLMGDIEIRGNELTLKRTRFESRAFAGNFSLIPQGTTLASGALVGVLSIAPPLDRPLAKDASCFGSPPVLMPARHRAEGHSDNLLFHPSQGRVATRLLIEGLRIVLPRAQIVFSIGFSLQIACVNYAHIGAAYTLLLLPAFFIILFALPALLLTALLKWILIGRYKPAEWPLWSTDVWFSEAITSMWETLCEPLLVSHLVGTPYLAWCFRLMGVKIGSRVTLLASDITEFDCVTIGDEAMVNAHAGAQTHLFEDRIMKVGNVLLAQRACMKPNSICLPGSRLLDGAQVGSLSLVMKGETIPERTAWEGAPVVPRKRRSRTQPRLPNAKVIKATTTPPSTLFPKGLESWNSSSEATATSIQSKSGLYFSK